MSMVVALVFLFNGEVDPTKTMYFRNLNTCVYYAQEYNKHRRNYEPTECVCRLTWVEEGSVRVL